MIRSDGQFTRDYIYVEDAANAYLNLAERMDADPGRIGQAFNFSYQSPLTALQVVDRILAITGREDLKPNILNEARNEIPHQYLNASKARQQLGWEPLLNFDEGLRRTVAWYQEWLGGQTGQ